MLELINIKKSFKISDSRSSLILNKINFKFPDKGMYFILGKSGCGKSTLLNIMSGLLDPDEGEIIFNGKNILRLSKKEKTNYLRHQVGILFQRYNLIEDMTVEENLLVAKSIKSVKKDDYIDVLLQEYGLFEKKKQKVCLLSGGEKQRIALIRTLINDPKIIFCDEPTGALDEENSIKLMKTLKDLSKEKLAIVVTHNESLFNTFNEGYLYLENGEIKEKCVPSFENKSFQEPELNQKNSDRKFIYRVSNKNIKKNIKRNLINTFSAFFTVMTLILSLFLKEGISGSEDKLLSTYGDKNTFGVSMIKNESIDDSPLSLERLERPTHNEIQTLLDKKDYVIDYSYDYFFSNKCELMHGKSLEKKINKFKIKPILLPSIEKDECLINNSLAELIEVEPFLKEIGVSFSNSYSYVSPVTNQTINELFEGIFYVKVAKIVDEFEYLNTPTLYVQTTLLENVFKKLEAKKSSVDREEIVSAYDLMTEANSNSEITNYKMNVFSFRRDDNKIFYDLLSDKEKNSIFKIDNFGYTMVSSFIKISNSVFLGMNIFIGIALLTTLFINGFLAYSSAAMNRKESAILSSLGATNDEITEIYLFEQILMSSLGVLVGTITAFILTHILNINLGKFFKFYNLITFDWIDIILIILVFIASIFISVILTLKIIKTRNIAEELKEE